MLIALCGSLMLGSCDDGSMLADDMDPTDDPYAQLEDRPLVMVHIGAIGSGREASSGGVERIRTLRIIMIQNDGTNKYIEANQLIDTDNADLGFKYIFRKRTVVGKKSFYLIANEGSVGSISLPADVELPTGMPTNPSLTAFLNYFDPDMPDEEADGDGAASAKDYSAADFESLITSLAFEPEPIYGKYNVYPKSGADIYLPYSAYYSDFEVKPTTGYDADFTDRPMYLVPVATKFSFKFINERVREDRDDVDVAVDYLAVEKVNKTNYLMANLDSGELYKRIGDQELYWINWLRLVAEELKDTADDEDENLFQNGFYGWIRGYNMPDSDDAHEFAFVPDGEADDPVNAPTVKSTSLILKNGTESEGGKITPTTTEFGPFYLPEGKNMFEEKVETDTTGSEQEGDEPQTTIVEKYKLKLRMRDTDVNVNEQSRMKVMKAETEISNLKSLFRNTSVLITITLREGGVNIYAEPVLWNKQEFFGYVKDEDEIK